ncbi:MAG: hypothetical protein IJY21_01270 [Clostridia bacterium]|nr:hypothetical protein [Clostridia bacterium]
MKKFLCGILAICMLCGAAALVGCKKDKGGNNNGNSSRGSDVNVNEAPGEWDDNWDL